MRYSTSSAILALAFFGTSTLAQTDAVQSSLYMDALSLASDIVSIGGAAASVSTLDSGAISSEFASAVSVEATPTMASDFPTEAVTSNALVQTALAYIAVASSILAESGATMTSGAAASSAKSMMPSAGESILRSPYRAQPSPRLFLITTNKDHLGASETSAASAAMSSMSMGSMSSMGSMASMNYAPMATAGLSGVAGAALLGAAALL